MSMDWLPGELDLAEVLGWSEEELRQHMLRAQRAAQEAPPAAATAELGTIGLLLLTAAFSVGTSLVAAALRPKPRRPGEVKRRDVVALSYQDARRNSGPAGFSNAQELARTLSPVPIPFARRETLPALNGRPAGVYGGLRTKTDLILGQVQSLGGAELFRGVYLVGLAPLGGIDAAATVIGNQPLKAFDYGASNALASRISGYFRPTGGRIRATDHVIGRAAADDIGNAENDGGPDVFAVRSEGNTLQPHFCASVNLSSNGALGLYGLIPNGMAVRFNPLLRPTRVFKAYPIGDSGDQRINPDDDPVALGAIWKMSYCWSTRSGITATSTGALPGLATLAAGDTFTYVLSNSSDVNTRIKHNSSNTDNDSDDADNIERCTDVANVVSGMQKAADDALIIGELYKAGSCLAVLISKTPEDARFASSADSVVTDEDGTTSAAAGQAITCTFLAIEAGQVEVIDPDVINPPTTGSLIFPPQVNGDIDWDWTQVDKGPRFASGTSSPQIHRCAVADFTLAKPAKVIEIGFSSSVSGQMQGFANLRDMPTLKEINRKAGGERGGDTLEAGEKIGIASTYQAGTFGQPFERYSFWRVTFRKEGEAAFSPVPTILCARGTTGSEQRNYIRVEFETEDRWQVRVIPLSGWEIRSGAATGELALLDARVPGFQVVAGGSGVPEIVYSGEAPFVRSAARFGLRQYEPLSNAALSALATTEPGELYPPGAYTGVEVVQGGNRTGRISLTVLSTGEVDPDSIVVTRPGEGYTAAAITISGGSGGPGPGPIQAAPFTFTAVQTSPVDPLAIPPEPDEWKRIELSIDAPPVGAALRFSVVPDEPLDPSPEGRELPPSLTEGDTYYVVAVISANVVEIATTPGGTVLDVGGVGVGPLDGQWIPRTAYAGTAQLGPVELGIGFTDEDSYIDPWGKAAQAYVYPEIQGSAAGGPENQVSYINVVNAPESGIPPSYNRLACFALNARSSLEFNQIGDVSVYLEGGHCTERFLEESEGPTHLLPEAFLALATDEDASTGQVDREAIIDARFIEACQWCQDRRYFFDANVPRPQNLRVWAAEQAPNHLLTFGEYNSRFYFRPIVTFEPVSHKGIFTERYIAPGTFKSTYYEQDRLRPLHIDGAWRDERASSNILAPGMFAIRRQVSIRQAGIDPGASIEFSDLDLSESCTNRLHLLDAMKYRILYRKYADHEIAFETTYAGLLMQVEPDDYIKIDHEDSNDVVSPAGTVLPNGRITCPAPLTDGTFTVLAWDGTDPAGPTEQELVITGGGKVGSLTGQTFTFKVDSAPTYQVMDIKPTQDGRLAIRAIHMPVNEEGRLLVSLGWDDEELWEIEG